MNFGELLRYGLSGVFNTLVNLVLFVLIVNVLNYSPYIGNLLSWIIGIILAFFIQRSLVFKSEGNIEGQILQFAMVAGIAYLVNIAVLAFCLNILPMRWEYQQIASQIIATTTYSISFYLFSKFWVFRK